MKFRKFGCLPVIILALAAFIVTTGIAAAEDNKTLRILFTHDMHDHFLPNKADVDGEIINSGGYSRLKTAIDEAKQACPQSVLVDGGDYSMGALFQTLFSSEAPELRIMGQMGYDATTFGNHEFDFRDSGLTRHLYSAINSGERLPEIVNSNIRFPSEDKMSKDILDLKNAMTAFGVKPYTILERNGFKIGIFGLIGKDAEDSAPMTGIGFQDMISSAKETVLKLREQEKADLVVCLSHSGTSKDKSQSEDEQLAKKVPGIDVIISGHTHTRLDKPIIVGKTVIGSCGEYGNYLGIIDLQQKVDKSFTLKKYRLRPISEDIKADTGISKTIDKYKSEVQLRYLNNFNLKFDEVLTQSPFSFIPTDKIGQKLEEEPLGNLISDGYMYSVKKAEGGFYEPADVAVVAAGTMRGSLVKGPVTAEDAFIVSSLGTGPDGVSGYPLISVYLTGKELMDLCEIDASVSTLMSNAQLYMAGISYTINPNRMIFNRVTEAHLIKADGSAEALKENKLYRVATGLYNAQMLSVVGEKSFGLLSIVPKDKNGRPITDFENQIIYDTSNPTKNEVKEWLAIAQYLKSFPEENGISRIPDYYSKPQGRKILDNSKSLNAILGSPNKVAIKIYLVLSIVVVILAAIIYLLIRLGKYVKRNRTELIKL